LRNGVLKIMLAGQPGQTLANARDLIAIDDAIVARRESGADLCLRKHENVLEGFLRERLTHLTRPPSQAISFIPGLSIRSLS
jgi:hypothetical protein